MKEGDISPSMHLPRQCQLLKVQHLDQQHQWVCVCVCVCVCVRNAVSEFPAVAQ